MLLGALLKLSALLELILELEDELTAEVGLFRVLFVGVEEFEVVVLLIFLVAFSPLESISSLLPPIRNYPDSDNRVLTQSY
jgi:hypothetical protein